MTELLDLDNLLKRNNANSSIRRKRIASELISLKNNYEYVNLIRNNELDSIESIFCASLISSEF